MVKFDREMVSYIIEKWLGIFDREMESNVW